MRAFPTEEEGEGGLSNVHSKSDIYYIYSLYSSNVQFSVQCTRNNICIGVYTLLKPN